MTYPFSQINRLEEPHSYMYTEYRGLSFLQDYQASRMASLSSGRDREDAGEQADVALLAAVCKELTEDFAKHDPVAGEHLRSLQAEIPQAAAMQKGELADLAAKLAEISVDDAVAADSLLISLLAAQMTHAHSDEVKIWLDRLVQRFEVTKKLYAVYPPGFRKGEGDFDSIRRYWLFALTLCLWFASANSLKALNALLKVCDLLSSLPDEDLETHLPAGGLQTVLAVELASVRSLAETQGVGHAFA